MLYALNALNAVNAVNALNALNAFKALDALDTLDALDALTNPLFSFQTFLTCTDYSSSLHHHLPPLPHLHFPILPINPLLA